jgi:hypothetical protein
VIRVKTVNLSEQEKLAVLEMIDLVKTKRIPLDNLDYPGLAMLKSKLLVK